MTCLHCASEWCLLSGATGLVDTGRPGVMRMQCWKVAPFDSDCGSVITSCFCVKVWSEWWMLRSFTRHGQIELLAFTSVLMFSIVIRLAFNFAFTICALKLDYVERCWHLFTVLRWLCFEDYHRTFNPSWDSMFCSFSRPAINCCSHYAILSQTYKFGIETWDKAWWNSTDI